MKTGSRKRKAESGKLKDGKDKAKSIKRKAKRNVTIYNKMLFQQK